MLPLPPFLTLRLSQQHCPSARSVLSDTDVLPSSFSQTEGGGGAPPSLPHACRRRRVQEKGEEEERGRRVSPASSSSFSVARTPPPSPTVGRPRLRLWMGKREGDKLRQFPKKEGREKYGKPTYSIFPPDWVGSSLQALTLPYFRPTKKDRRKRILFLSLSWKEKQPFSLIFSWLSVETGI